MPVSQALPRHQILMAEAQNLSLQAVELLWQAGETRLAQMGRSELMTAGKEVTLLWLKLGVKIDRDLLTAFPNLKCLAVNTTGLAHLDLQELEARGISVLSLKGETGFLKEVRATAELTLLLMLSLLRRSPEAFSMGQSGQWDRMSLVGQELSGKTVGLIGFGRLGRITGELVTAFRAEVLWFDPAMCEPLAGAKQSSLDDLLAQSDIVSLHASWEPGQPPILTARELSMMQEGAMLINTARGELVDETALLAALEQGRLTAALDVLANEQGQDLARNGLVEFSQRSNRLILTPHLGGATKESSEKTEVFMAKKIKEWCEANPL